MLPTANELSVSPGVIRPQPPLLPKTVSKGRRFQPPLCPGRGAEQPNASPFPGHPLPRRTAHAESPVPGVCSQPGWSSSTTAGFKPG